MHALPSPPPNLQPTRRSRTTPSLRPRRQRHPHRSLVVEASVKLAVNAVLSTVAVSALVQLLPYIDAQQEKLAEVQAATKSTEERLHRTQEIFSKYFDPYQTKLLMQEQSNRIAPQQREILLQENQEANPTLVNSGAETQGQPRPQGY